MQRRHLIDQAENTHERLVKIYLATFDNNGAERLRRLRKLSMRRITRRTNNRAN